MKQPNRPFTLKSGTADDSSLQLTDVQLRFADVVGRELARLWIEEQAATSSTNRQNASSPPSHKEQ